MYQTETIGTHYSRPKNYGPEFTGSLCLSCEHYGKKGWAADTCQEKNYLTCPLKPHKPATRYNPGETIQKRGDTPLRRTEDFSHIPTAKLCIVCMRWFHKRPAKSFPAWEKQLSCSGTCGRKRALWFTEQGLQIGDRNRLIRKKYAAGKTMKALAKEFKVSRYTVQEVIKPKNWGRE